MISTIINSTGDLTLAIASFTSAIKALMTGTEGGAEGSQGTGGGEGGGSVTLGGSTRDLTLAQIYCNRSAAHAANGAHTQVRGVNTERIPGCANHQG